MQEPLVLYDVEDGIATVTLNRPDRLNALTRQGMLAIVEALDRADADDGVRAIIITGAGRAFCAGADLSAGEAGFSSAHKDEAGQNAGASDATGYSHPKFRDGGGILTLRMFQSLKPIVGAINGAAVGIGATMLLPMDVRVAAEGARISFPFVRLGIVPEAASSWFLPRIVGISRALEWTYSAQMISAQEALEGGLLRSVHAGADLLPAARALARKFTQHSAPVSIALTRQMMWRMLGAQHPMEAHRIDSRGVHARSQSADAREGVASFKEKRDPRFSDRVPENMPDFFPWWEEPEYR